MVIENLNTGTRRNDMKSDISVLLVDDHQVVREGLRRILQSLEGIKVLDEASDGEEAVEKAKRLLPDVVIMDLKMPGMDGVTATREIKEQIPQVNVLILTLYAEDFVRQAIEAGASGYILKDSASNEIARAIRQVFEGQSPIAPSLSRGLMTEFAQMSRSTRSSTLTPRQIDILKLIAEGVSSENISTNMYISASTVKREIRNIFNKLGVNDRSHAVSQAIKRQLI